MGNESPPTTTKNFNGLGENFTVLQINLSLQSVYSPDGFWLMFVEVRLMKLGRLQLDIKNKFADRDKKAVSLMIRFIVNFRFFQ